MTDARDVLVIGRNGQVARAVAVALRSAGHRVFSLGREEVDLSRPGTIEPALAGKHADLIVNAAAYTAVDRAEGEPEAAQAINATSAGVLAAWSAHHAIPIVHFSTDYVFDGSKPAAYCEEDPTCPLSVYGRSKRDGEQLVAANNPRHVILRTAWVFSADGHNFVKTMLRLAAERSELAVVDDQRGSPTSAEDLGQLVASLVPHLAGPGAEPEKFGLFHAVNAGSTTWCGFARAIMEAAARRGGRAVPVRAITSAQYPTRARRPENSVLATDKLAAVHGFSLPPWQDALERCLDRALSSTPAC